LREAKRTLTLGDSVDLVLAMAKVFAALDEARAKLAEKGILMRVKFNAVYGTLVVKFYRTEAAT